MQDDTHIHFLFLLKKGYETTPTLQIIRTPQDSFKGRLKITGEVSFRFSDMLGCLDCSDMWQSCSAQNNTMGFHCQAPPFMLWAGLT